MAYDTLGFALFNKYTVKCTDPQKLDQEIQPLGVF